MNDGNDFQEVQHFSKRVFFAVCLLSVAIVFLFSLLSPEVTKSRVALEAMVPVALLLLIWRILALKTLVTDDSLTVQFPPFKRSVFPKADIISAEVVQYRPLADFGGWGFRIGTKGTIYNARGNQAVKLDIKDTGIIFIGSQQPENLLAAIEG